MTKFMSRDIWCTIDGQAVHEVIHSFTGLSLNAKVIFKPTCSRIDEERKIDVIKNIEDRNLYFVCIEEVDVFSDSSKLIIFQVKWENEWLTKIEKHGVLSNSCWNWKTWTTHNVEIREINKSIRIRSAVRHGELKGLKKVRIWKSSFSFIIEP